MSNRITEKDLRSALAELAEALDYPAPEQYNVKDSLRIACAYGGCRIEVYIGEGGCIRVFGSSGFNSKRQVYEEICNMTAGARMSRSRKA